MESGKRSTALVHVSMKPKTKSSKKKSSRSLSLHEKEEQRRIDVENRILLRKILEQHQGVRRRGSSLPPKCNRSQNDNHAKPVTSNKINDVKWKQKRDYENLILLQKIQNVKPSASVSQSFKYFK